MRKPTKEQRPRLFQSEAFKCCKDCGDRFLGCHSSCERYQTALKEFRVIRELEKLESLKFANVRKAIKHGNFSKNSREYE